MSNSTAPLAASLFSYIRSVCPSEDQYRAMSDRQRKRVAARIFAQIKEQFPNAKRKDIARAIRNHLL